MEFYKWDFPDEDGREIIREWSKNRIAKMKGLGKSYNRLLIYAFDLDTLRSFIKNFNFMVIIQMTLAAVSIYIFKYFNISFDFHVSLFVSPIVFPLAFSINTDFQRREKVLEDLANFKAAAMLWFFCMREWKQAAELDDAWLTAVHEKVKNMMFNLREYLFTDKIDRRRFIVRCLYEDFSDTNQLIEKVRASKLPMNTSIISRVIHLLNMLCVSFERLRVIREYRSPRSIRSFNKVLIFFLPIILSPYFVFLGKKDDASEWCPYYIAVLVAGVFGALQGVQDKLDDPFDGMSEDDIKLDSIDEWTFHSLENIVNRNFTVGRFHVVANIDHTDRPPKTRSSTILDPSCSTIIPPTSTKVGAFTNLRRKLFKRTNKRRANIPRRNSSFLHVNKPSQEHIEHNFDPQNHPYADVLEKIKGNSRVQVKKGTGTVLVTNTYSDMNKMASSSSISSDCASNKGDELELPKSPKIVTFREENLIRRVPSGRIKENEINATASSDNNKRFVVTVDSPQPSIESLDSDPDSLLASPTMQPLIHHNKPPFDTLVNNDRVVNRSETNRFKLANVPNTQINKIIELKDIAVIENNNFSIETSSPRSPVNSNNEGELNQIVIVNSSTGDAVM